MKILITTDLFTTETNGVVTSVKNLCHELIRKGHDVRILTLSDCIHSRKENDVYYIRSIPIGIYPNVRMPLSYRHSLIRELIAWNPDIIHSQCEFFSFQYARRISKLTGAPLVHTYHTLYEQYVTYVFPSKRFGMFIVRSLLKKRFKHVDQMIVPTEKVKFSLRHYEFSKPVCIVPSGISLEQHKKRITEQARRAMRTDLGISSDQTVLINLGRLGVEKNLDEILYLFAKARRIHNELILLIVGDGPAKAHLIQKAKNIGIGDSVIFTGMVEPSKVQEYYQIGDVFVSASTSETQGLTYIEAAANGLPLLCKKDPCLSDIIRTGENGFEYTCEEEFLNAVKKIVANKQWRMDAGKCSETLASVFDQTNFGNAVETIYKSTLENKSL